MKVKSTTNKIDNHAIARNDIGGWFNKAFLIIVCVTLSLSVSFAASKGKKVKTFPTGCQSVGYSFQHGVLMLKHLKSEKPQSIYFIHNVSNQSVKMYQVRDGKLPYILHSNAVLRPDRWGAFANDRHQAKFICTKPTKNIKNTVVIDCEKVLKLCQYPKVKFAINNRGNYWATTNQSMKGAVRTVIRQGVLLKWW